MREIKEKDHRLPPEAYTGMRRATFTISINEKKPVFIEENIVDEFLSILEESLKKHKCANWIYIFMPDHMHIINEGLDEDSNLLKSIVLFKQQSGYWFSKHKKNIKWQKDFYDHIHRKEEDLPRHIKYILENPVRKGIVNCWDDYTFKGSLDFVLEDLI